MSVAERAYGWRHRSLRRLTTRSTSPGALAKISPVQRTSRAADRRNFEISANDKRFLRSLRIAADETQEKEVE